MPIYYINTGTSPNAGNGDVLRTAFWKANLNFEYLNSISSATFTDITTDIIPAINNTYSLGSPVKQWKELFVSTGSIYLGNVKLSNNNGQLQIQKVVFTYNTVTNEITTETVISGYAAPTVVPNFTVTNTLTVTTINLVDTSSKITVNTATDSLLFNNDDVLTSNAIQTFRTKTYEGQLVAVTTGVSFTPYEYTHAIFVTEVNDFSEVSVKNISSAGEASADFVCYNDRGDGTTFYIDMGMNSSNYNSGDYPVFIPNSGYLYTGGGTGSPSDLIIGTATTGSHLKLFSGGIGVESVRVVIHGDTGNIILGDDANLDDGINKLQIRGSTTMTGSLLVSGTVTATIFAGLASPGTTSTNSSSNVGYLGIPQNSKATGYTTLISDQGKHIYVTATATMTIDSNTNVPYPIGTTITFIAGSVATATIAITSDTMYLVGAGTTGSRTLAPFGMATAVKVAATTWFINGTGLT